MICKRKFCFFAAGLAALLAVGCSKENVSADCIDESPFMLEISVPESATKATQIPEESKVNSLQIYVFRENGALEAYGNASSNSLKLECLPGKKTVVALANAPEIKNVLIKDSIDVKISDLQDNSLGSFVMYGSLSTSVTSYTRRISVPVTRLVARISIKKITNKLSMSQYENTAIHIKRMYIMNAAGDFPYGDTRYETGGKTGSTYAPKKWYNLTKPQEEGDLPSFLNSGELSDAVASSKLSYEKSHYFYCYPNPTGTASSDAHVTRLVIEALINDNIYYYPLDIKGIENNHTYNINELVITRLGSESPEIPVSYSQVTFTVYVNGWQDGSDESVTI